MILPVAQGMQGARRTGGKVSRASLTSRVGFLEVDAQTTSITITGLFQHRDEAAFTVEVNMSVFYECFMLPIFNKKHTGRYTIMKPAGYEARHMPRS